MSRILVGDALDQLRTLPDASVQCIVTSPPYWGLRDYGVAGQIGLEASPQQHVDRMVEVFRECRRVLRDDGTAWVNYGDSYAGSWGAQGRDGEMAARSVVHARQIAAAPRKQTRTGAIPEGSGLKPKDLVGMPWRIAFALQADGWWLRSDIIWSKPNPMPESVTDRPTKSHEYLFLLAKSERYYYDGDAIREPYSADSIDRYGYEFQGTAPTCHAPGGDVGRRERERGAYDPNPLGRNRRTVWSIPTQPFRGAHFATFPPEIIRPCIRAGCPRGGVVLDPFFGSGTTGVVCDQEGRDWIGIELNPDYAEMARRRTNEKQESFA